jgi:hypothetical protein
MSESINVKKSAKRFMVFDAISRRIEDVGKIARIIKMSNAEVELFDRTLYFRDRIISNKRRVFAPKGLGVHSSAFNLSGGRRRGGFWV